jgi:hypothetical protein
MQGSGSLLANGQNGGSTLGRTNIDAAGGGGGGGTVVVHARTSAIPNTLTLRADGGVGGNQLPVGDEAEGPGGGGGGGFIAINAGSNAVRSASGGLNGTTASTSLAEFPANGATSGGAGIANAAVTGTDVPFCANQKMLRVQVTDGKTTIAAGATNSYTVTIENNGITDLGNAVLNVGLPESPAGSAWLSNVTWTCAEEGTLARCASASGTGAIANSKPTLPSGGKLTYVISGTVNAPGNSVLTTTVHLTADAGVDQTTTDQTTVEGQNSAPTISHPGTQSTNEDTALVLTGTNGISVADAEVTGLDTIYVDLAASHGTMTLATTTGIAFRNAADGTNDAQMQLSGTLNAISAALATLTYTPNLNYNGPDTVTITANDRGLSGTGGEQQTVATVGITVAAVNDAPLAVDDTAAATNGQSAVIDVRANDTDVDGDALRVLSVTTPVAASGAAAGTATLGTDGKVTYVPPTPGINDTVTFEYTVSDGNGGTDTGKVTVTVGSGDGDGDGLTDADEILIGTNPADADSDDDGVRDGAEPSGAQDTDGDGLINALDPDSDNDGLFDGTELGQNCNDAATDRSRSRCIADADEGATKTDPLDRDTDDGSVSDGAEDKNRNGAIESMETNPTTGHGADDTAVSDRDKDGLSDEQEVHIGSNPDDADTDDDGLIDGQELNPTDDTDRDGLINVLDADSDNDGLFDGTELGQNCANPATDATKKRCKADANPETVTSPLVADTDAGGVRDGAEDVNLDGKQDAGEIDPTRGHGSDDKTLLDSDGDGLTDAEEEHLGSNPNDVDTDDDGLSDGAEANPGEDTDGDGLINVLDVDSDGDGLFDGTETGKGCGAGTDITRGHCIADADPTTQTSMLLPDTDHGGMKDGTEDTNKNGAIDAGERNPLDPADDGCGSDSQCGSATSGRVCNFDTGVCVSGCRGTGGNGCPEGDSCSSTNDTIGTCSIIAGVGGASSTSITSSAAGASTGGATLTQGGATVQSTQTEGGATIAQGGATHAYSEPETDPQTKAVKAILEGGGCSCTTASRSGQKGFHLTLLAIGVAVFSRARRLGLKRRA